MNYLLNDNTKSRPTEGVNSPENHALGELETRPVEILNDQTETAESLTGWFFLLAEASTSAPWSSGASLFVDRAIAQRETFIAALAPIPPPKIPRLKNCKHLKTRDL